MAATTNHKFTQIIAGASFAMFAVVAMGSFTPASAGPGPVLIPIDIPIDLPFEVEPEVPASLPDIDLGIIPAFGDLGDIVVPGLAEPEEPSLEDLLDPAPDPDDLDRPVLEADPDPEEEELPPGGLNLGDELGDFNKFGDGELPEEDFEGFLSIDDVGIEALEGDGQIAVNDDLPAADVDIEANGPVETDGQTDAGIGQVDADRDQIEVDLAQTETTQDDADDLPAEVTVSEELVTDEVTETAADAADVVADVNGQTSNIAIVALVAALAAGAGFAAWSARKQ